MGIVRTSGTGKEAVSAGEIIEGGALGVVSAGETLNEEAFDMMGDGMKSGEFGSEVASCRSRRSLFSWLCREKGWDLYGLGTVSWCGK